jgi:hypothetical protein
MSDEDSDMRKQASTQSQPANNSGALLNDTQAAAFFGVEPRTLRLWRVTRGLPYIRLTSKVVRYRQPDLDAWADRHRNAAIAA